MQEEVDNKVVSISVKGTKLTGRALARAMMFFLKKLREPSHKTGKQSVKSLSKQGSSLSDVEISGDNIGSFSRVARKYNIDFALKKDKTEMPPRWYVFFKSKDVDSLTAAMKEYSRIMLKHKDKKPSILETMAKARAIVRQAAPPVRNRKIGGHEL